MTDNSHYRNIDHQIASEVLSAPNDPITLTELRQRNETANNLGLTAAQVLSSPNTGQQIDQMVANIFNN